MKTPFMLTGSPLNIYSTQIFCHIYFRNNILLIVFCNYEMKPVSHDKKNILTNNMGQRIFGSDKYLKELIRDEGHWKHKTLNDIFRPKESVISTKL